MAYEKSFVTVEKCIICRSETGSFILDKENRNRFDHYVTFPTSLCDECRAKYLKEGVLIVNQKNGKFAVLKVEAFKRIFKMDIPEDHIAIAKHELFVKLGLE